LYYLQSRYYSPDWGRFINADGLVGETGDLLSANMFAYCKNNPVNLVDPNGESPFGWFLAAAAFVTVSVVTCGVADIALVGISAEIAVGLGITDGGAALGESIIGLASIYLSVTNKSSSSGGGTGGGGNTNSTNNNDNNNNKNNKDSDYRTYDPKQIEKKYGLKKNQFHLEVKPAILSKAREDFPKKMMKIGKNPDIQLNSDGFIRLVPRPGQGNGSVKLPWDIQSFKP
jgi:hypothetical protein